jgi:protein O-mannosyl-transferase
MSVAAEGGVLDALTRENVIISRGDYLLTQFNVICTYIRMLFLHLGQNLDHDYPISRHLLEPGSSLLSLIILLSIAGFGLWLLKRHRMISFGIFWFFLALSIESSIIPIKDVIVEHRVYLPMFGFVLAFTCGVFLLVKNPKACVILLSVVVVTLAGLTFARNRVWKDGISLWSDVIKKSPYKARPYMALGVSYADRKNYDKAIEYYKKALELQPHNAQIHYNLSNAYDRKDKRKEQIDHLEIAIQLSPDYASPYAALGLAYGKEGQYDKAIEYSKKALKLNPNHTQAHHNLGVAYAMSGKKEQALEQLAILKRMNRDDFASMLEQDIAEMGQPVQAGKDGVVTLPWRPGEGAAG